MNEHMIKSSRKIEWRICNITKIQEYTSAKSLKSKIFSLLLDGKKTTWQFEAYCDEKKEYLALYFHKVYFEATDFTVKFSSLSSNHSIELKSDKFTNFYGWPNFLKLNQRLCTNIKLIFEITLSKIDKDYLEVRRNQMPYAYINCSDLLKNEYLSDFEIICSDGEKIPVHALVLSKKSSVFNRMFAANMKEKQERQIEIEDFDSEVMKEFLRFVYTGDAKTDGIECELFCAADKYDVFDLRYKCVNDLINNMKPEKVCDALKMAVYFMQSKLKKKCIETIIDNYDEVTRDEEWTEDLMKIFIDATIPQLKLHVTNEL